MTQQQMKQDSLSRVGLTLPRILLPSAEVDRASWAVVACDQYTSEPEYWRAVDDRVGARPSTAQLIFPEVYLERPDAEARVQRINAAMQSYLREGILQPLDPGFVLVQRDSSPGGRRTGLMVAIDLEQYDYRRESTSLVRATEGTIVERLPPRMQIRRHAAIELPHIMVLIDDPGRTVIEPLVGDARVTGGTPLYDFPLMQGGGHLRGHFVPAGPLIDQVTAALGALATGDQMAAKYGDRERGIFLYAMGDGNHSLATAKAIWDEKKAAGQAAADHPARHALVELVNVHDEGLLFEPIHRVLFGVDKAPLWRAIEGYFAARGAIARRRPVPARTAARVGDDGEQIIPLVDDAGFAELSIARAPHTLAVGSLQGFLDEYLREHPGTIDYIHGDDTVEKLACASGAVGFFLPTIAKHDLFKTVLRDGPLPRKAFSMGEAHEKRFYMEARKIVP